MPPPPTLLESKERKKEREREREREKEREKEEGRGEKRKRESLQKKELAHERVAQQTTLTCA